MQGMLGKPGLLEVLEPKCSVSVCWALHVLLEPYAVHTLQAS